MTLQRAVDALVGFALILWAIWVIGFSVDWIIDRIA